MVKTALGHQAVMGSGFSNTALVNHKNLIRNLDGEQAVSDDYKGIISDQEHNNIVNNDIGNQPQNHTCQDQAKSQIVFCFVFFGINKEMFALRHPNLNFYVQA